MMQTVPRFPLLMGAAMGGMMPFMLHRLGAESALWFVLAHLAVAALALLILGTGLARLAPGVVRHIRGHRPSLSHLGLMLAGGLGGFALVHFWAEIGGLH